MRCGACIIPSHHCNLLLALCCPGHGFGVLKFTINQSVGLVLLQDELLLRLRHRTAPYCLLGSDPGGPKAGRLVHQERPLPRVWPVKQPSAVHTEQVESLLVSSSHPLLASFKQLPRNSTSQTAPSLRHGAKLAKQLASLQLLCELERRRCVY